MAKKIIPPVNGFTTTFLNNLKPQNKPYEVGDKGCKGLRIKISNTGSKAFLTTIRIDSKRKVFTLGYYPNLSLSDARKTLLQMKSGARNGKLITDKERKQQQETERLALEAQKKANTITLGEVLKDFINTVIDKRRAPNPPKSLLNAHIFSHELASAPIRTVTKTDIKALIFNVRKDREPSAIELFYLLKQLSLSNLHEVNF